MSHFGDLMRESGRSLFLADCQGLESVHSALRKSDVRHQCHTTNMQGTELHLERSVRSVSFHNARTLGFVMPPHLVPPDPDPGDEEDDEPEGDEDVSCQDEENNERVSQGFSGDHLEPENQEELLAQLEHDLDGDEPADSGQAPVEKAGDEAMGGVEAEVIARIENQKETLDRILNQDRGTNYTFKELLTHIANYNLPLKPRKLVKGDGNCFFTSILDLVEKFQIPNIPNDKHLLRLQIIDSIKEHPEFLDWVQNHFYGELEYFEAFAEHLRGDGKYTDNYGLTTAAAAHMLGNDYMARHPCIPPITPVKYKSLCQ